MDDAGLPLGEYKALIAKVDAFLADVLARRRGDMRCQSGCTSCCHVRLSLTPVEAESVARALRGLSAETRIAIAEAASLSSIDASRPCAMLDATGRCSIYSARPLVCRTHGLPLRYPADTVPIGALLGRAEDGSDIVTCPLNFQDDFPAKEDILDAERVDTLVAVVNARFAARAGQKADQRVDLEEIARGCVPNGGGPVHPDGSC